MDVNERLLHAEPRTSWMFIEQKGFEPSTENSLKLAEADLGTDSIHTVEFEDTFYPKPFVSEEVNSKEKQGSENDIKYDQPEDVARKTSEESSEETDNDDELIDLYVKFDYKEPSAPLSRRTHLTGDSSTSSGMQCLSITDTAYKYWCRIKVSLGLVDDTAFSVFLLNHYKDSAKRTFSQSQCLSCGSMLSCPKCHLILQPGISSDTSQSHYAINSSLSPVASNPVNAMPHDSADLVLRSFQDIPQQEYAATIGEDSESDKNHVFRMNKNLCSYIKQYSPDNTEKMCNENEYKVTEIDKDKNIEHIKKDANLNICSDKYWSSGIDCATDTSLALQRMLSQEVTRLDMGLFKESPHPRKDTLNCDMNRKVKGHHEPGFGTYFEMDAGLMCDTTLNNSAIKTYECRVCWKVFFNSSEHHIHMRTHTGEKRICKECGATFASTGHLTRHMRKHSGDRPFTCQQCRATFTDSSTLKKHMLIHVEEKPFKCDVCTMAFARSDALKVHRRAHTGEKPFPCKICNAAFRTSSHLKLHVRKHSGSKPFSCKQCDKAFSDSSSLRRHTMSKSCGTTVNDT